MSSRSKKKSTRIRFQPNGYLDSRSVLAPYAADKVDGAIQCLAKDSGSPEATNKIITGQVSRLMDAAKGERTDVVLIALAWLLNFTLTGMYRKEEEARALESSKSSPVKASEAIN